MYTFKTIIFNMYKIEREVYEARTNDSEFNQKPIEKGFNGRQHFISRGNLLLFASSLEEAIYIQAAMAIPYDEMLREVEDFNNRNTDETDEAAWIDGLSEKYNLEGYAVVTRIRAIEKLSHSLIYKSKMESLYRINQGEQLKMKL